MRRTLIGIALAIAYATFLITGARTGDTDSAARPPTTPAPAPARPPIFTTTEAAPAGSALRVFVERDRLVGWIAGTPSFAGRTAKVSIRGVAHEVPIDGDNTFSYALGTTAASEATVEVGPLVQRTTLPARSAADPSVLFVVDRNAYRPGDKLSFAGFLRRADGSGYAPLPRTSVELRIDAERRKVSAARMRLVSDDRGRISGEYTFSSGDPLDTYALTIQGYRGTARVELAEQRKSRVKLDLTAAVRDGAAVVDLSAVDFVGAPVPGGTVELTAQIVRDDQLEPKGPLAPQAFAYGAPGQGLSRDATLGYLADPDAGAGGHAGGVVTEVKGQVALDARGRGTHRIPLKSELSRGQHRLVVEATMTEPSGRELRAHRAMPLARRDVRLVVSAPHEVVAAGTPVRVAVTAVDGRGAAVPVTASVVAMKAAPSYGGLYLDNGYGGNIDWIGGPNGGWRSWNVYGRASNVTSAWGCQITRHCRTWQLRRASRGAHGDATATVAAIATVADGAASIKLDDAGAYRLIASATLGDGSTVWSELGVAVREEAALPPVVIELDREQISHGERITGRIESRYRDATALVLVRDGSGIRAHRRVALTGGRATFDIPAGTTLGYGAAVEAYLLGPSAEVLAAQQLFHVAQTSRELAVTARADKKTYGPGELVDLDVSVGRAEAVDLAISVFDQSLLGLAPDRAADPRSFYYADDRLRDRAALATIAAQIGDLTVGAVLEEARAIQRSAQTDDPERQAARQQAEHLVGSWRSTHVGLAQLVALLQQAGVQTTAVSHASPAIAIDPATIEKMRVVDLLAAQDKLAFRRIGDAIVVGDPAQFGVHAREAIAVGSYAMGNASYSHRGGARGDASFSHAPVTTAVLAASETGGGMVRRDFSDSALWTVTRTGADGKARVRFKLPDSLTTWRVVVTAIGGDAVGRATSELTTLRDVMVWPVLPAHFTEGDTVDIAGNVRNLTGADRDVVVVLHATNADLVSSREHKVRVPAGSSKAVTWRVRAKAPGFATLRMTASAEASGDAYDASEKRIPVAKSSADQVQTASGFADKPLSLELPAGIDPREAVVEVSFAPSLAADMVQTLDYLVEYPYGCAEQTMSRFAPAIRVAGTLKIMGIAHGKLAARVPGVVDAGVKRLASLQQPDGGWGWTGSASTHETVTPYVVWGLMEAERAGYAVPDGVIKRGLDRVRRMIDTTFSDAQLSDRTYLMHVLAQREKLPDAWWRALVGQAGKMSDYALALALEIAVGRGDRAQADAFAATLRTRAVRANGLASWTTGGFSRWMDDPSETTAAVLKALVAHDVANPLVPEAISFFVSTKRGDRWNSTKDTAMVLYAITEYVTKKKGAASARDATVEYTVDGGAAQKATFPDGLAQAFPVKATGRKVTLAFPSASPGMLVRLSARYHRTGRDLAATANGLTVARAVYLLDAKGGRARRLATGDRVPVGAFVESVVEVTHGKREAMRFMLVEDPKPAGAELMPEQDRRFPLAGDVRPTWVLREDREAHVAFHHEHTLADTARTRAVLRLERPGDVAMAPAQAELMYQTQTRGSSGTFVLRVE